MVCYAVRFLRVYWNLAWNGFWGVSDPQAVQSAAPPMAELKTQKNTASVNDFIAGVADKHRRQDCMQVIELMRSITQEEPAMWGSSIVGFGSYHYKYASGREGDWFLTGFSPRKQNLTLY